MTDDSLKELVDGYEIISINLTKDEIVQLAYYAHERDITINQAIVQILEEYIDEQEEDSEIR